MGGGRNHSASTYADCKLTPKPSHTSIAHTSLSLTLRANTHTHTHTLTHTHRLCSTETPFIAWAPTAASSFTATPSLCQWSGRLSAGGKSPLRSTRVATRTSKSRRTLRRSLPPWPYTLWTKARRGEAPRLLTMVIRTLQKPFSTSHSKVRNISARVITQTNMATPKNLTHNFTITFALFIHRGKLLRLTSRGAL